MDAETIFSLAMLMVVIAILAVAIVLKVRQDNAKANKDQVWVIEADGEATLCDFKRINDTMAAVWLRGKRYGVHMDGTFVLHSHRWYREKPVEEPGKPIEGAYYNYHPVWLVQADGSLPGVFYSREEADKYIDDAQLKVARISPANLTVPKEPAIDPKLFSAHWHSCGTAFVSGTSVKTVTTELPSEVYAIMCDGCAQDEGVALTMDDAKNWIMDRGYQCADDRPAGNPMMFRKESNGYVHRRYIVKVPLVTRSET